MSEDSNNNGKLVWYDLTVDNADEVRDFYSKVAGWKVENHSMGDYNDYVMKSEDESGAVGICHKRGSNSNIPSQWMIYIQVENVEQSAKECVDLGGKILDGPRLMGKNNFCVIKDPAGAVAALIEG